MKKTCLSTVLLISLFAFAFICGPSKKKEGKNPTPHNPYS